MSQEDSKSNGWDQFTIVVDETHAPAVSEALIEMGALGLSIEDDETLSVPEKPVSETKRSKIVASFASSLQNALQVQSAINELLQSLGIAESSSSLFAHIPEQDYAKQFQQSWKAFAIGEKIWIVPSWEEDVFVNEDKDAIVIHMDPELAFGTGQHETTKLCSEAVLKAVRESRSPHDLQILDVGTGTGILAFVGVLAGAGSAVATDNDPEALKVASENAKKNKLDTRVTFSGKDPDKLGAQFDIVVANILAFPLIELAPRIVAAVKPKGRLFLSGLLTHQAEEVAAAYRKLGMGDQQMTVMNEWAMLSFIKS